MRGGGGTDPLRPMDRILVTLLVLSLASTSIAAPRLMSDRSMPDSIDNWAMDVTWRQPVVVCIMLWRLVSSLCGV